MVLPDVKFDKGLPGQEASMHVCVSLLFPTHPVLEQVRALHCVPDPHVTLHPVQLLHSFHVGPANNS